MRVARVSPGAAGSATIVALQILRRRPLADLLFLPLPVMISGFFGVAGYTLMLALAFGIAAPADLGQVNPLHWMRPPLPRLISGGGWDAAPQLDA